MLALIVMCLLTQDAFPELPRDRGPFDLPRLDRLVELYRGYHLPIPPKEAPLVRLDGVVGVGGAEPSEMFRVGYLLDKGPRHWVVLSGTTPTVERQEPALLAVDLETGGKIFWRSLGVPFPQASRLVVAVIERTRGNDEFALRVLRACGDRQRFDSVFGSGGPLPHSLEQAMAHLALSHWLNESLQPGRDRAEILVHVQELMRRHPGLNQRLGADLLKGLEATVARPVSGNSAQAALIDALLEVEVTGDRLSSPDPAQRPKLQPLIAIAQRGEEMIPLLLEHADDPRLTRAHHAAFRNASTQLCTVGDVCRALVMQFRGGYERANPYAREEQARMLRLWWASRGLTSE
jgi:hypothetical protein